MADNSEHLLDAVRTAFDSGSPLCLNGNRTKNFLRGSLKGDPLSTCIHDGIIQYEPTELVITARSGATIQSINAALAEQGQMLAFDPPQFDGQATLGGIVATGLSGPARPWTGSARDFVLGTTIISGRGEQLHFGGQVMKNVAGYDVSRLMVGAYGSLGLLLDISFKVLPRPEEEATLSFEMDAETALMRINTWCGQALPLSGACWLKGALYVRVSG